MNTFRKGDLVRPKPPLFPWEVAWPVAALPTEENSVPLREGWLYEVPLREGWLYEVTRGRGAPVVKGRVQRHCIQVRCMMSGQLLWVKRHYVGLVGEQRS
jgi:hypothetical protein